MLAGVPTRRYPSAKSVSEARSSPFLLAAGRQTTTTAFNVHIRRYQENQPSNQRSIWKCDDFRASSPIVAACHRVMPRKSSIILQNASRSVTLFDIPRSLELAQGLQFSQEKRILSSSPPQCPWTDLPEPKSTKAIARLEPESIEDLLLRKYLELALQEVKNTGVETWLLPRVTVTLHQQNGRSEPLDGDADSLSKVEPAAPYEQAPLGEHRRDTSFYQNMTNANHLIQPVALFPLVHIPPRSSFVNGFLENSLATFTSVAPRFSLVVIDPPWPNRSARRKNSYSTSPGISSMLPSVVMDSHLADNALVGVWITNKASFRNLILQPGGLFDQWGLELEEEWVWLKITSSGDPIFALESRWRKPYEILLLGRKMSDVVTQVEGGKDEIRSGPGNGIGMTRRVIIAVPDLHSRKPNLKELFEPMLPVQYEALEIFARNLTEGWWAWGNEVCKFQSQDSWVERQKEAPEFEILSVNE